MRRHLSGYSCTLALLFIAVFGTACAGDDGAECGDGTTLVDGRCVANAVDGTDTGTTCGTGTEAIDGQCVPTGECPAGQLAINGECFIDSGVDLSAPAANPPLVEEATVVAAEIRNVDGVPYYVGYPAEVGLTLALRAEPVRTEVHVGLESQDGSKACVLGAFSVEHQPEAFEQAAAANAALAAQQAANVNESSFADCAESRTCENDGEVCKQGQTWGEGGVEVEIWNCIIADNPQVAPPPLLMPRDFAGVGAQVFELQEEFLIQDTCAALVGEPNVNLFVSFDAFERTEVAGREPVEPPAEATLENAIAFVQAHRTPFSECGDATAGPPSCATARDVLASPGVDFQLRELTSATSILGEGTSYKQDDPNAKDVDLANLIANVAITSSVYGVSEEDAADFLDAETSFQFDIRPVESSLMDPPSDFTGDTADLDWMPLKVVRQEVVKAGEESLLEQLEALLVDSMQAQTFRSMSFGLDVTGDLRTKLDTGNWAFFRAMELRACGVPDYAEASEEGVGPENNCRSLTLVRPGITNYEDVGIDDLAGGTVSQCNEALWQKYADANAAVSDAEAAADPTLFFVPNKQWYVDQGKGDPLQIAPGCWWQAKSWNYSDSGADQYCWGQAGPLAEYQWRAWYYYGKEMVGHMASSNPDTLRIQELVRNMMASAGCESSVFYFAGVNSSRDLFADFFNWNGSSGGERSYWSNWWDNLTTSNYSWFEMNTAGRCWHQAMAYLQPFTNVGNGADFQVYPMSYDRLGPYRQAVKDIGDAKAARDAIWSQIQSSCTQAPWPLGNYVDGGRIFPQLMRNWNSPEAFGLKFETEVGILSDIERQEDDERFFSLKLGPTGRVTLAASGAMSFLGIYDILEAEATATINSNLAGSIGVLRFEALTVDIYSLEFEMPEVFTMPDLPTFSKEVDRCNIYIVSPPGIPLKICAGVSGELGVELSNTITAGVALSGNPRIDGTIGATVKPFVSIGAYASVAITAGIGDVGLKIELDPVVSVGFPLSANLDAGIELQETFGGQLYRCGFNNYKDGYYSGLWAQTAVTHPDPTYGLVSHNKSDDSFGQANWTFSTNGPATAYLEGGVSSESGWDFMRIRIHEKVNGSYVLRHTSQYSGEWQGTFSWAVPNAGQWVMEFRYMKDGSVNRGQDRAWAKRMWVVGPSSSCSGAFHGSTGTTSSFALAWDATLTAGLNLELDALGGAITWFFESLFGEWGGTIVEWDPLHYEFPLWSTPDISIEGTIDL